MYSATVYTKKEQSNEKNNAKKKRDRYRQKEEIQENRERNSTATRDTILDVKRNGLGFSCGAA